MGYVMFTARKLLLTSRINNLNYKLLQISEQRMRLTEATGNLSARRNTAQQNLVFNQEGVDKIRTAKIGDTGKDVGTGIIDPFATNYELENKVDKTGWSEEKNESYNVFITNAAIQDFEYGQTQAQQDIINAEDKYLELQQKAIETQLNAAMQEIGKVEQSEGKLIEMSTPKYGGSQ